ncbi:MAG: hypothetical protein ACLR1V_12015 [Coprococcus sp.]
METLVKVAIRRGAGYRFVDIVNGLRETMLVIDQSLYVRQQTFAVLSEGDAGSTSCQRKIRSLSPRRQWHG